MSRRAQRWFFWTFAALVAWQMYVVREWLAGLLLVGVVFAVVAVVGAMALILDSAWKWFKVNTVAAWQAGRAAVAAVRVYVAKPVLAKAIVAESHSVADSNSSR